MAHPSHIQPDIELREFLDGRVFVGDGALAKEITVYGDWERPTNMLPDDFIVIMLNGDIGGVGMDIPYADGYIMVSLYCKLNNDGSAKKNRITKILEQFDKLNTEHYYFRYDAERFITPTTPNQSSGYSITTLNLLWHTKNNLNS